MGVSKNSGFYPKSSILIGFFIIFTIHFGYPYFWKHPHIFKHFNSNFLQIAAADVDGTGAGSQRFDVPGGAKKAKLNIRQEKNGNVWGTTVGVVSGVVWWHVFFLMVGLEEIGKKFVCLIKAL